MRGDILAGDCREVMSVLADASIDAIVTDPPYGLGFMGKAWDRGVPGVKFWQEMLRVAKPGAYLLAFGGTRTFHRMACAIEDAGWEVRDNIARFYTGDADHDAFLDSLDGAQREAFLQTFGRPSVLHWVYGSGFPKSHNGPWGGTALKPAHEPIIMARKPLVGTVAANVLAYGTGGLNIDGCRVPHQTINGGNLADNPHLRGVKLRAAPVATAFGREGDETPLTDALGRWPANVIHDGSEEVLAAFPDAPGQLANASTNAAARKTQNTYGAMRRGRGDEPSADSENAGAVGFKMRPCERRLDSGTAARFFYCAKASRKDRNEGCEAMPERPLNWSSGTPSPGTFQSEGTHKAAQNNHPTVKPTELMRYLVRLVTPRGGVVLDPFCGSGSTGKAAVLEGFDFIGIERDPQYVEIARARVNAVLLEQMFA